MKMHLTREMFEKYRRRQKEVKEERGKSIPCSPLWAIKSESGLYSHKADGWYSLLPDMRTGLILDSLLFFAEDTAKELSERFGEKFKPIQVEIREA